MPLHGCATPEATAAYAQRMGGRVAPGHFRLSSDGLTLSGVTVLLAMIALAAAGVPAYRAARIDPQTSLRCE